MENGGLTLLSYVPASSLLPCGKHLGYWYFNLKGISYLIFKLLHKVNIIYIGSHYCHFQISHCFSKKLRLQVLRLTNSHQLWWKFWLQNDERQRRAVDTWISVLRWHQALLHGIFFKRYKWVRNGDA